MDSTRWHPSLEGPFRQADLEQMLADALDILERVGVQCAHRTARRRLEEWGGARIVGDRMRFNGMRVRDHLERRRAQSASDQAPGEPEFSMGGCWAGLNYCDPQTQEVRPASNEEAALMARLWDARGLSGVVPVMPGQAPPALATLTAERIALENSRRLGGSLSVMDPEEVRFLIDMNLAAGRRYTLVEQIGISPLRFDDEALEAALCFLGQPDLDVVLTGSIPMAGATCPLAPRAAAAQAVAETLALDVLCSVLGMAGGGLEIRVEPFDLQYTSIVFGSPEWCLLRAMVIQVNTYLTGRVPRSGMFRSVAKRPDAQAACERTASVLWQALLGARRFGAVGQLSVDEVFSPQQAVIDKEILGYVQRVLRGLDLAPSAEDPVALVQQGIEEGAFLGIPDTVARFREFYHFPDIFRHWSIGRWRAEHEPSILDMAWDRARQEISTSTFQLGRDAVTAIARIYDRATRYVRNKAK